MSFIASGIGLTAALTSAAGSLGLGATAAGLVGAGLANAAVGAGLGAGVSALTGGDPGKGALLGAGTGFAGGALGGAASAGSAGGAAAGSAGGVAAGSAGGAAAGSAGGAAAGSAGGVTSGGAGVGQIASQGGAGVGQIASQGGAGVGQIASQGVSAGGSSGAVIPSGAVNTPGSLLNVNAFPKAAAQAAARGSQGVSGVSGSAGGPSTSSGLLSNLKTVGPRAAKIGGQAYQASEKRKLQQQQRINQIARQAAVAQRNRPRPRFRASRARRPVGMIPIRGGRF